MADIVYRDGGVYTHPQDILRFNGSSWVSIPEGLYRTPSGSWERFWPLRAPRTVSTFDSIGARTWDDQTGWRHTVAGGADHSQDVPIQRLRPQQGQWGSQGNRRGLWFYGRDVFRDVLSQDGGRKVIKIEVYLGRHNVNIGSTTALSPRLWGHAYNKELDVIPGWPQPHGRTAGIQWHGNLVGAPVLTGGPHHLPPMNSGEERWYELPVAWGERFASGEWYGLAAYTPNGAAHLTFHSVEYNPACGRIRITHD